jgi:hypothetical protein
VILGAANADPDRTTDRRTHPTRHEVIRVTIFSSISSAVLPL